MLSDEEQRAVYDKCRDYMASARGREWGGVGFGRGARPRQAVAPRAGLLLAPLLRDLALIKVNLCRRCVHFHVLTLCDFQLVYLWWLRRCHNHAAHPASVPQPNMPLCSQPGPAGGPPRAGPACPEPRGGGAHAQRPG